MAAIVATWALAGVAQANPVVINFETAPPLTLVGPGQPETSYTESGVTFTPTGGDALVDPSFCALGAESCIANNGSVYLTALNGAEVTITAPRAFSLNAFDAAFLPLPTPVGFFSGAPMGLKIVGTLWDGGTVEAAVSLLEDPNFAGDFLFASYSAGSSPLLRSVTLGACVFTGIDCERSGAAFDAAGFQLNDLQFAIDNLSLSIPEPSALWLVALSLGGLALTRRRCAQ
jgi:hypothetical protein